MGKDNEVWLAGKLVFLSFFLAFFIYPLAALLLRVFSATDVAATAASLVLANLPTVYNSFAQAAVSTLLALAFGLPAAYVIAKKDFPLRNFVKSVALLPFVFPSILVVLSFVIVLGNNGWVNSFLRAVFGFEEPVNFLYGFTGIAIGHVFYNFPVVAGLVSSAWEGVDARMGEAARTLGAGRLGRFAAITLPQLLPAIAAAGILVFIYCFMSFTIVLSFGGLKFSTLEVEIYSMASRGLDFTSASILASVQFVVLALVAGIYWAVSRRFRISSSESRAPRTPINLLSVSGALHAFFLCITILFVLVPLFFILVFSLSDPFTGGFSLRAFEKIFSSQPGLLGTTPILAVFYSLAIAFAAAFISVFMAFLAAIPETRVKFAAWLLSSSVAVSAITLALGYYIAFGPGNIFAIIFAHAVLAFPFAFFSVRNALRSIGPEAAESARTLGASQLKALSAVTLPRISGPLVAAFAFSFAVSLGELGIVLMLYNGIFPTMPVYIYRLIGTFSIHSAAAMGLILVLAGMASFYVMNSFSREQWRLA